MKLYKLNLNTLEYKKINNLHLFSFVIIYSFIVIISTSFTISNEVVRIIEKIPIKHNNEEFNKQNLKQQIESLNLNYPDVIFAQAVLESSNFSSGIFKENNNLFGMKEAKTRPTTSLGTNRNHAYYKTWQDCVVDYSLWQSAFARNLTKKQYIQYIGSVYAEDTLYVIKINKLINKIK